VKAALLWLLLALGGGAGDLPGQYRLVGEPDTASSLVLRPDGRFEYFLAAGALDEEARGRWSVEGGRLVLVTEPRPMPPVFVQAPSSRTGAAPLQIVVRWPGGGGIAGVDLRVGFDAGEPVVAYTQEEGWSLPKEENRTPRWIELGVPMHGLVSPRLPIDLAAGNALAFVLNPNDLGVLDFRGVTIERAGDELVVHRGEGRLRYRRVRD
jgi:hypothetical protein